MPPLIRDATEADLPPILDITNDAIANTTALWYLEPLTLDNRRQWFQDRLRKNFPILVAQIDHHIAAFASFGPFRPQPGYDHTAEHSLYVAPNFQRQNLGSLLLNELIARAHARNLHALIGCIDAANTSSIDFHKKHGFRMVGHLPEVGRKFNRWLDLIIMQLPLAPPLSDESFLAAFESQSISRPDWTHRAHVKVAYLYLTQFPFGIALEKIRTGIQKLNAANKIPEGPNMGYNETTTVAFAHLIAAIIHNYSSALPTPTADIFCDTHRHLLSPQILRLFYSPARRLDPCAKSTFLPPDLTPFPPC